ncbi:zinc finger protein NUTCRACKER [Musa acuminata AAA Group]|uniref:zinc finger protein NUTCRACKER n=1 Tax=Musa acuminata AAA Group TaxID=214697 RepID=UPI0031CEEF75
MAGEAVSKASQPLNPCPDPNLPPVVKKKRNLPGTPDPEAEVIALSPGTLLATNRFLCEICGKGFQRDQNLQLHRRGHNLPWKLKQRSGKEPRKRVYVCPEESCIHHNPARALGDLTGIKKHFCRKHGEKKWKCDKCSKRYAVQSDWKAHSKTCGTREYRCDCGVLFSRRDSFITHRAFCDALAEETARVSVAYTMTNTTSIGSVDSLLQDGVMTPNIWKHLSPNLKPNIMDREVGQQDRHWCSSWMGHGGQLDNAFDGTTAMSEINQAGLVDSQLSWIHCNKLSSLPTSNTLKPLTGSVPSLFTSLPHRPAPDISATALLQKAAQVGAISTTPFSGSFGLPECQNTSAGDGSVFDGLLIHEFAASNTDEVNYITRSRSMLRDCLGGETRDFLGVGVQTLCQPSANGWI